MKCDYFFWLLLAEWFGLGVALPGLPSYPGVQKLSPVLTEHGVVYTRQSTEASGRISLAMWLARAVCTWKYGALFRYGPRVWQSLSLCMGVACGERLDFPGDAWDAVLGSPVDGLRRVWVSPVE